MPFRAGRFHSCPAGMTSRRLRPTARGRSKTSPPGCLAEPRQGEALMIEWSETDLLIRDAVRAFIDKEVRPNVDALESGEMPPYPIIRKLFSEFGLDVLAAEAIKNVLDRERAR